MAQFETQHENPQLQQAIRDLTWRVVQQKLGNVDEVENRDKIRSTLQADQKKILASPTFKDWILPALKAASDAGTPYKVISYYKNEDPNAPYDGFMLKAPAGSKFETIEVNLETDLEDIYGNTNIDYSGAAAKNLSQFGAVIAKFNASQLSDTATEWIDTFKDDHSEQAEKAAQTYQKLRASGVINDAMVKTFTREDPSGNNELPTGEESLMNSIYSYHSAHEGSDEGVEDYLNTLETLYTDVKPKLEQYGSLENGLSHFTDEEKVKAIRLEVLGETGGREPTAEEIQTGLDKIEQESKETE